MDFLADILIYLIIYTDIQILICIPNFNESLNFLKNNGLQEL